MSNAEITTRGGSDGRTRATIRLPDVQPVNELAKQFVAIRTAFHDAGVGLAKMRIEGKAIAPQAAAQSASSEPGP